MSKVQLMLDIETLATVAETPVIPAVGMATWKIDGDGEGFSEFFPMNIQEQIAKGFAIEAHTLQWWMLQDKAAQSAVFGPITNDVSMMSILMNLAQQIRTIDAQYIWSRGSFDQQKLEAVFRHFGISIPWKYNQWMDVRSVVRLVPKDQIDEMVSAALGTDEDDGDPDEAATTSGNDSSQYVAHSPVDDCIVQIYSVQAACKLLGITELA